MRETGSTIEIKLKTDTSGFTSEMKKVKDELDKVESSTEKLSRSTAKGSGLFRMYGKEIRSALNEFKATGDLTKAQATFAGISARVDDFGNSMRDSAQGMQEFYTLTNQITSATATLNREYNNSAGVIKANEAVQRSLNEETKKSADILRRNAQARKYEATQVKQSAQEVRDNVTGQIALLRRLSVQGQGSAEEIAIAFNRTATTTEELAVTTEDLTQAFIRQNKAVESSRMSFKNKQQTLNQIKIAEEQTAQSMRKTTAGLGQQENQVGDVSYAMVSFTRLLEDMPYGFRGFANNIQPTVYGLIQLNDKTNAAALAFRQMHGREMPLTQRAMINFKSALSSPINQLLLLTSVVAVAGTMIERWSQQANKAKNATNELGQEFLKLYDVTKGDNPLDVDYTENLEGLDVYLNALKSAVDESKETLQKGVEGIDIFSDNFAQRRKDLIEEQRIAKERLSIMSGLTKEGEEYRKKLIGQLEVLNRIKESEQASGELQRQYNENRIADSLKNTASIQEQIRLERIRQTQGENAAIRLQYLLLGNKILDDETLTIMQAGILIRENNLNMEAALLRIKQRQSNENKASYESTVQALQRQLQDETKMSSVQRLRVEQAREVADLEARHTEAKEKGAEIEEGLLEQEIELINKRYDLIAQREGEVSARIVANLSRQAMLSDDLVRVEQEMLFGDEARGIALDLQIQQMEYQNQLADKLDEIKDQYFPTDRIRLRTEENITREMRNQYNLSLMRQKADAMYTVSQFLSSPETEEMRIMQNAQQAMLASTMAFEIEKLQLKERFKNSAKLQEASLTALTEEQAKKRQQIERTAALQIALIRFAGYSQGLMMITSAFDQLNTSMEAKNRSEFERQKRFSASMATINTFLGVSQVLADANLSSFMKFATATSMAITGFAQVRQILATKYGGASTGGFSAPRAASEGFVESDVEARGSINGTMNNSQPTMIVNVTGTVDKEGIAWAVMEGTDQINSRGIVLQ
jgi:hypothetical protein